MITIQDILHTVSDMNKGKIIVGNSVRTAILIRGNWYPVQQLVSHTALVNEEKKGYYSIKEAIECCARFFFTYIQDIEFPGSKPIPLNPDEAMRLSVELTRIQHDVFARTTKP